MPRKNIKENIFIFLRMCVNVFAYISTSLLILVIESSTKQNWKRQELTSIITYKLDRLENSYIFNNMHSYIFLKLTNIVIFFVK